MFVLFHPGIHWSPIHKVKPTILTKFFTNCQIMDSWIKFGKAWVKIFAEQILDTLTYKLLFFHSIITHIYDNHINLKFLYIFGGSGLLCVAGGSRRQTLFRDACSGSIGISRVNVAWEEHRRSQLSSYILGKTLGVLFSLPGPGPPTVLDWTTARSVALH